MQRLELTWIGKGAEPQVEPRILLHDPSKDYGDPNTENMLIHGDNLLALKALEQQYAGQVKCIYIDPPYNTNAMNEHYDDFVEHSVWLSRMRPRLELLRSLLREDGTIWIQIDDEEQAYLKVLCDEVFGRSNFVNMVSVNMKNNAGASGGGEDKRLKKNCEYIEKAGTPIKSIIATGGGSKSDIWCQLQADITGLPILVPKEKEAACLGAAIIAAVGDKAIDSFEKAIEMIEFEKSFEPSFDKNLSEKYKKFNILYEFSCKLKDV